MLFLFYLHVYKSALGNYLLSVGVMFLFLPPDYGSVSAHTHVGP